MTKIKEKDIVNKIIENFNDYFPELKFHKKEFSLRNFRVDISSYLEVDLKELHEREDSFFTNIPVFFEVKYNSEMRDLLFELEKQVSFRDWYINIGKCFSMVCVISDKFEPTMIQYMKENNIYMFKTTIKNDDIATLKIEELKI